MNHKVMCLRFLSAIYLLIYAQAIALVEVASHSVAATTSTTTLLAADSSDEPELCITKGERDAAVTRLSRMVQFVTVSSSAAEHHVVHLDQFAALHQWLPTAFPAAFQALTVEKVGSGNLSYLLTWPGSNSQLRPALFISHLDVVPVAQETLANWTHPPFSGAVDEGYIYGRGTLDVKVGVTGLLEGMTLLLASGFAPQRTLMFSFGQDEEVGGEFGAAKVADLLRSRGVQLEIIWDEGGSIDVEGVLPFTNQPIALISTAEKGYASVQVKVSSTGGHSSIPPTDGTSVGSLLGRVLTAVDQNPPPVVLQQPVIDLLKALAPHVSGLKRYLFEHCDANSWLRNRMAKYLAASDPANAALVRTTVAPTFVAAGFADNVLPSEGEVHLNFRLLPGQTVAGLYAYLQQVLHKELTHIALGPLPGQAPTVATSVTPASGDFFQRLKRALQDTWRIHGRPVDVAPILGRGGTDSAHYQDLTVGGTLRHVPVAANRTDGDQHRVHGLNERVSVDSYGRAICTYRRALELFASP